MNRNKNKKISKLGQIHFRRNEVGFTLIEILVVVAIIGLLSSITLIALLQARSKGRDARRLGDITQMNTAMELYFSTYKGYPSDSNGLPQGLNPQFLVSLPTAPGPADGICEGLQHVCGGADQPPCGTPANTYYYVGSGTPYTITGTTVYPDYNYYFCLGGQTGNFSPGAHIVTPRGIR